jgi:hypothetical protein
MRLLVIEKKTKKEGKREWNDNLFISFQHVKMPPKEKEGNSQEGIKRVENKGCTVGKNESPGY